MHPSVDVKLETLEDWAEMIWDRPAPIPPHDATKAVDEFEVLLDTKAEDHASPWRGVLR